MTASKLILPDSVRFILPKSYGIPASDFTATPIGTTGYACFSCKLAANELSALVLRLLNDGVIRVLVATEKSLGEEWHISCVNTLIPVCSVSSSVAVPRIRGNVLYADRNHPEKTVHIWHIATIERDYSLEDHPALRLASRMSVDNTVIRSLDYDALCRRFNCFIAPGDMDNELETGIDRLARIRPPFTKEGLEAINSRMLESAAGETLKNVWADAMVENTRPVAEAIIPKRAKVPVFTPRNVFLILTMIAALIFGVIYTPISIYILFYTFSSPDMFFLAVMLVVIVGCAILWAVYTILYMLPWFINHLLPKTSVRSLCVALLRALKEQGEINKKARFIIEPTFDKQGYRIYLDDCSAREQTLFQEAACEMFSPIRNPDFIIIRAGMFNKLRWKWSFACPEVIGRSDVFVKVFEKHLRLSMGLMKFQYTHRDPGRKYLIIARNKSYLNFRDVHVDKRLHVLKHDRF